jgi:hypothetical protein
MEDKASESMDAAEDGGPSSAPVQDASCNGHAPSAPPEQQTDIEVCYSACASLVLIATAYPSHGTFSPAKPAKPIVPLSVSILPLII